MKKTVDVSVSPFIGKEAPNSHIRWFVDVLPETIVQLLGPVSVSDLLNRDMFFNGKISLLPSLEVSHVSPKKAGW